MTDLSPDTLNRIPVTVLDMRTRNHAHVMAELDKLLTPPVYPSIVAWDVAEGGELIQFPAR